MSTSFSPAALLRLLALLALLLLTRVHHVGSALHLPDASWAVFFLGGFYFSRRARPGGVKGGVFWLLLAAAVAIDFALVFSGRSSGFCLTPGYLFLLPAYAALWQGGRVLAQARRGGLPFVFAGIVSWAVAASVAYLVSNASFYWLSGRYAEPNLVQYLERAGEYYLQFVTAPAIYLVAALALHGVLAHRLVRRVPVS